MSRSTISSTLQTVGVEQLSTSAHLYKDGWETLRFTSAERSAAWDAKAIHEIEAGGRPGRVGARRVQGGDSGDGAGEAYYKTLEIPVTQPVSEPPPPPPVTDAQLKESGLAVKSKLPRRAVWCGMSQTETVQQIYEAFGRGDVPAILDVMADNVEWESWSDHSGHKAHIPWFVARRGKAGVAEFFGVVGQMKIREFQVLSIMAGGNQVAVEFFILKTAVARQRL